MDQNKSQVKFKKSTSNWVGNEKTIYQNLQNTAKAVQRGKFIALNVYSRKEEKSQINHLSSHLKNIEKEEGNKPTASRRNRKKEIIKIIKERNSKQK